MTAVGDLVANLSLNSQGFTKGLSSSRSSLSSFGSSMNGMSKNLAASQSSFAGVGSSIGGLVAGGVAALGALGAAVGVVKGAIASLSLAGKAEQTQVAFETMTGNADQAKALISQLVDYANHSSFDVQGATDAAQKLLNYGTAAGDVVPTIKMLGDVAAGDSEKFDRLATAFGQTSATGRLMGQDLLQFINAGFNPLQEISKKTGESMGDLKARMEAGGIAASEVKDAFVSATSEGGQFFGMTDRQSQTLVGRFNTLKDAGTSALRDIGQHIMEKIDFGSIIEGASTFITTFTDIMTAGIDFSLDLFHSLAEGADAALVWLGQQIGIDLDLSTTVAMVQEAAESIPTFFRNASPIIETAAIDWHLALYELVPGSAYIVGQISSYFIAGWDGISASAGSFVQNVMDGIKELGNVAQAIWAGIQATFSSGSFTEGFNEAMSKFASQAQSESPHFTEVFSEAFNKTLSNATEGIADQGGFANVMKSRKEELASQMGATELAAETDRQAKAAEKEQLAKFELPKGKPNPPIEEKNREAKKKEKDNEVILAGSKEAAKALSGSNVEKEQLQALKQIAKNTQMKPGFASDDSKPKDI